MTAHGKATLTDIARMANVSRSTASMILSGRPGAVFTKNTVERVKSAADALGYIKKASPRCLFERPTIGIIITIITGSYYTFISQAITQQANRLGFDTICFETHRNAEREQRLLRMIEKSDLAGILFAVPPINLEAVVRLSNKIPTVVVSSHRSETGLDTVMTDDYQAGVMVAQHLLSLGHRHVAFIDISRAWQHVPYSPRLKGVKDIFDQKEGAVLKIVSHPAPDTLRPGSFLESRDFAREMTYSCLGDQELTAFIAASDYAAYGVMDALAERRLKIPEDYSVCGFDDIFSSSLPGVSLTTTNRHPIETGVNAFELLIQKIKHPVSSKDTLACITRIEYKSCLMIRKSTAAPRGH